MQAIFAQLLDDFDVFLVDQFGVLIDSSNPYPGALDALQAIKDRGKRAIILTNSAKRATHSEERLARLGFTRDAYFKILSSGDVAHKLLAGRVEKIAPERLRIWFHIDSHKASPMAGLDVDLVGDPGKASLLVIGSAMGEVMTMGEYRELLSAAAKKRTPCICINPDLEKLTPDGVCFGAGRVARLYHDLGGPTEWVGKPYSLIYDEIGRFLKDVAPQRVLCIGDSPAHDIAGGKAAGFKTALVRTGIHEKMTLNELSTLCRWHNVEPDFIIPAFNVSR